MRITELLAEAKNPKMQAAIAINMKKRHQKPKSEGVAEGQSQYTDMTVAQQVFKDNPDIDHEDDILNAAFPYVVQLVGNRKRANYMFNYDEDFPADLISAYRYLQRDQHDVGLEEGETWSKHNNPRAGGMSKKSVKSYRRSHPGSKIQTAVTTKPSKLKKGSKAAKRRLSFCRRMRGMKKHRTSAKTARDPNSNINKSLRRWHCESVEQMLQLVTLAEQFIQNRKQQKAAK